MSVVTDRVMPRQRISVEEYYRMAEDGRLSPDARVELIEGEIIDMPPIGTSHAACVAYITHELVKALNGRVSVRVQCPILLAAFSQPQPDFAIVEPREDHYKFRHPRAADTLLIIEVSNSSLGYDKSTKVPLYARYGVPEVWWVDVARRRLEIFRRLEGGFYGERRVVKGDAPLTLAWLPDVPIHLPKLFSG